MYPSDPSFLIEARQFFVGKRCVWGTGNLRVARTYLLRDPAVPAALLDRVERELRPDEHVGFLVGGRDRARACEALLALYRQRAPGYEPAEGEDGYFHDPAGRKVWIDCLWFWRRCIDNDAAEPGEGWDDAVIGLAQELVDLLADDASSPVPA